MDERFSEQLSRILSHLYDLAFLETSPLAAMVSGEAASNGSRGKALRKAILDTIESLRPPEGTPSQDAAWRPYRILEAHYVAGMSRGELQDELCLAKSQYYREHARALEALSSILWHRWKLDKEGFPPPDLALPDHTTLTLDELAQLTEQELPRLNDVAETLRDLAALLTPTLQGRRLTLELELAPTALWVRASPGVLRQSLLIPLSEALKTLAEGTVCVRAWAQQDQVLITIASAGSLAAPVQAESQKIARSFVESAGGAVTFGTEDALQARIGFPLAEGQRLVMLVDNSQELANLFERFLEGEEWTLLHAQSVEEALKECERRLPALILLDVLMPGQDGWHLLARLKSSPVTAQVPVVICSVLDQPELALSLGADGYLRKPVTQEGLREALQRWGRPRSVVGWEAQRTASA